MTKEAIKQMSYTLIDLLPRGAIKEISKKTGLDRNSVRMILKGVWSNSQVIDCALQILIKHRNQVETAIVEISQNRHKE